MWILYATQEEMMLAQCELIYLTNLISFFKNSHYFQLTDESFLKLSELHLQFEHKMKQLEPLFEANQSLFAEGQEIELLEGIYSNCKKIRECFHAMHKPFLTEIDSLTKNKLNQAEALVQDTLSLAEKNITSIDNEKDKSDLEQLVDYLKLNTQSLLNLLNAMRRSINQLSITHETIDMTLTILQKRLGLIERFYAIQLTTLHFQIISKLDFAFSKKQHVKLTCDAINTIHKTHNNTNIFKHEAKLTLWSNNPNNKQHQKDIKSAVQFIEKYLSFFYAPFNERTKRLFTRWGNANAKELTEVSDRLRKHLNSNYAIEHFSDALFSLKEGDDDSSLRKILDLNRGLLGFIKECIEFPYPIIGKWDRYHTFDPAIDAWDRYYSVYR